jgi:hypothetical protein
MIVLVEVIGTAEIEAGAVFAIYCETRVIGAPSSMAWLAWAWRSQWAEIAALIPARFAVALTM